MSSTSPGVPGFETISVLADGPRTIVRARSRDDGAEVIVKLLDPASEPLLPRRFDRRRRALLRLSGSGRGFVPLLADGIAGDGRPYVVVPHLALGSLQDQLDRGPTPWFPASKLMAKVAEAVGRAHDEDAPLGDIRPSKILLERADTPVISAFGMASRRFDDGRPSYRAPEADNDTPATAPADVYSLSLILATLIAGRAKERREPVESFLTELVGLAPARIHEVLEHGLAESVTNRYGSGGAMHRALTRAIDDGPDQVGREAPHEGEAGPADLDRLLDGPIPVIEPRPGPEPSRSTADGLPPDLDDLTLVGGQPDDRTEDDRLLLPPGLDDIVLASRSSPGADDDDTTPFPDVPGSEPEPIAADVDATGPQRDEDDGGADGDGVDGIDGDDPEATDLDPPVDPGADDQEIVDLTELFTRTHEFVYDPEIHGPADRPGDDGPRSGVGPTVTRPPGPPPSISTTTLLRQTDPVATPALEGEAGATAATIDLADANGTTVEEPAADEATIDEASAATPAPPQMPARTDPPVIDDDPTDIFPGAEASPPWLDDDRPVDPGPGSPPLLEPDRSEAIPFPNMARVRNRVDDHRWHARARTRIELLWFRSRRTVSTVLALLGLLAIVAIVVLFAAREIRSATTSVDTEGVPQPLTTETTGANFVSTDAPFITDVPPSYQPTTATTVRRRAATTSRPATTAAPATRAPTTARPTTSPPTTEPPTTTEREPTTTERTTITRRRRRTTTTAATTPTTEPTTTIEILPTTEEDDEEDDERGGRRRGQGDTDPPGLSQPTVVTLSPTAASITFSSDRCVATRFRLAGSDGSVQSGSSRGYEASVQCSSAWNLDFSGSSGLTAGVAYTLSLTVKDRSGRTATGRVDFTTPA